MRWLWAALCIHLRIGVSRHTQAVYTPKRMHNNVCMWRRYICVCQCTDLCTSTLICINKHRPPSITPVSYRNTTQACNQEGKEGEMIRQGRCIVCITTVHFLCISPLTSFSPSPTTYLPLSHPHTPTLPSLSAKQKATNIFKRRAPHIFWYATDSKGPLFLYGYACCGAT